MKLKYLLTSSALVLALASSVFLSMAASPVVTVNGGNEVQLSRSVIYWEYNATANDLGVHVTLDGENWKRMKIFRPNDSLVFDVKGYGPYNELGMTELFFEGAEPNLGEFPLSGLLARFPEGTYDFEGETVEGDDIEGESNFSHAIPAGPRVAAQLGANNFVRIAWAPVTTTPIGFPARPIVIKGYQVIVGTFQVTLPSTATFVTLPPEFVASLLPGVQAFEVLAIEQHGNQTLTEGSFVH
ncbi:MAG: hypothetical protein SGI72_02270 [Planctomycetota bacterium]|nr:hypothetical protein [Planctomycetota bacterium]